MKPVKMIQLLLSLFIMVTMLISTAQAALKAVGPTDVVTTLPTWYQDTSDQAIAPCLDQNGFCILTPNFDPFPTPAVLAARTPPGSATVPITQTGPINDLNFPNEIFYYLVDSLLPVNGFNNTPDTAAFRIALEASFLTGVFPGGGQTFLRINLQRMKLTPSSTYTVTHPYGTFQFSTDGNGDTPRVNGQAFRVEDPVVAVPGVFFPPAMQQATKTHIGPWLRTATGLVNFGGNTYLGDPRIPTQITGSPLGTNFFRIDGPNIGGAGVNTAQTDLFTISGRVFTGPIARPLTIDRATYARDANSGQVDIFVSSLANATIQVSGTGITTTAMTPDTPSSGNYFINIPLASSTLPTSVVLNNSLDLNGPIPHPVTLVDEVNITEANYNQVTKVLTVKATSRDQVAPLPTLSVAGFAAPNTLDSTGTFTSTLADIPPQTITVLSTRGGVATAPISVGVVPLFITTADPLPNATIGTLYNQTIAYNGGVGPYTWAAPIGTLPTGINFFPGSGTLFGNPTTPGAYSFTLQLTDSLGTTAIKPFNLTVVAPPNPIAVDDTATTPAGTTVVINVLTNDTATAPKALNPATLSVSAATGGTVTPNLNGTVSYTAPLTLGNYSFSYTVKDTALSPLTSNVASVVVTVTLPPPVAPTLVGPNSTVATATPVFTWNAVANAASYTLWNANSGFTTYTATAAGCPLGSGTCSATLATPLPVDSAVVWAVNAINAIGTSPWSAVMSVTFSTAVVPVAPTLVGPNSTVATATPVFTWNAVANAASYTLWNANSGFATYTAAAAGCPLGTGTCSATLATPLPADTAVNWAVESSNFAGTSPWSAVMSVTFSTAVVPVAPALVGPNGTVLTATPTYTWSAIANATSYTLWNANSGFTTYTATAAGCPLGTGTCSATLATPLPAGTTFAWAVKATNTAGSSAWSPVMSVLF